MLTGLSIEVLGKLQAGVFSPCTIPSCSYFQADHIAVGSTAWSFPAVVLNDSTVSPRHALITQENQQWVIQDLDSDNGIRSIQFSPGTEMISGRAQQACRIEFAEQLCCCIGAVVLRIRAVECKK